MQVKPELIATIHKNRREEIRITLGQNNGRPIFMAALLCDSHGDGVMHVHRHIAFRTDLLPQFAEGVALALERAQDDTRFAPARDFKRSLQTSPDGVR
ncbi:MAG: hypothetical protein K0R85_389 [Devosia sp.]|jgi:hypothetical protein|nr:hypothetical protein [Devosia sp.]